MLQRVQMQSASTCTSRSLVGTAKRAYSSMEIASDVSEDVQLT